MKNTEMIKDLVLFKNVPEESLDTVFKRLQVYKKRYKKGVCILSAGEVIHSLGIVLSGCVSIIQRDIWGKENIFSQIKEGEMFGETYALLGSEPLMVDVIAESDTEVLFLNIGMMKENVIDKNTQLIMQNLLRILAYKNIKLSRKIEYISARTIKERLMSYLQDESIKQQNKRVHIPFNRQQLADYLCVDRSALSNEISKLQKARIIKIEKHYFYLKI